MPDNTFPFVIKGFSENYPVSTLNALFSACAQRNPSALALKYGEDSITYAVLKEQIDAMARYFWTQGMRPGQHVAISLKRSPELITAIFAVLKCGAAYIPIDTAYPDQRLELMVEDAKASFLISDFEKKSISVTAEHIFIEDILKLPNNPTESLFDENSSPESTAYIIYTSGSTGKPKGVQVTHHNVINLVYAMGNPLKLGVSDKIFAITTISFDAMIMEIFLPLLYGSAVIIVDDSTRLDGDLLLNKAEQEGITLMWGTPSIWQILLDSGWEKPLKLKALCGGEAVPLSLARKLLAKCLEVWNVYGPTETTVCSFFTQITQNDDPIVIGRPIANTHAYLLDTNGNPVLPGAVGEIAIGGAGVSKGYLERPELNAQRFIADPFVEGKKIIYLSGDLGKMLPNGQVQCLGRIDNQVKIRGYRIELGEIELVLDGLKYVKRSTVVVSTYLTGQPQLVAYLQPFVEEDTDAVRTALAKALPDYMIPTIFMWVAEFPITTNGKIDKKNLPLPKYTRPISAPLLRKPRTLLEKQMVKLWEDSLQVPQIGIDDNFFQMGGTSLLTQKLASQMKKELGVAISVTKIYQYPTIAGLSKILEAKNDESEESDFPFSPRSREDNSSDVAVIGMAGRFPGASTINELWEVLKQGRETTSFFTADELDNAIPENLRTDPLYIRARGIVPSAKTFDAAFFGLNPKHAEAMDPQQRLFLEIAWEVLEQTGHLPKHYKGKIGVYAGSGTNTYYKKNIYPNKELLEHVGQLQLDTLNEKDYIASRTAYHLNLKGPAVSVHSACSTSLLAVAEAVEAIRKGQCDAALAGGASVTSPIYSGHLYQEGSMLSADGHCRSFDASGSGTVFSDGAGVVLLKKLSLALADGDDIIGVIKGVGINNDGGNKGSFTAPSAQGQSDAIKSALLDARLLPSEISYVEAHGTATPLGDPIEIEGLQMAFGKPETLNHCALGSIKSNMGHLTAAAGVAGLIKTMLALKHKQIPASLGFEKPNPTIDFENSSFFVNTKLSKWETQGLRKAGISSFGVGGTNVHVIVEEYPEITNKKSNSLRPLQLLTWSAKTANSLEGYRNVLETYVKDNANISLGDVSYSLQHTRENFSQRTFVVAKDHEDFTLRFNNHKGKSTKSSILKTLPGEIVFLFPGQGAQFPNMGRALYENEKVFRNAVDHCSELLKTDLGLDLRDVLYPKNPDEDLDTILKDTKYTQPALFVTEYALAQLWMHWGIVPQILCGHSIGEFVAAHLAGVFSLEDVLHLIAVRGKLVSELPKGAMLSVRLQGKVLAEILPEYLSIAAINSENLYVVAGVTADIAEFSEELKKQDIPNMTLSTSHAFHSAMMDPVLPLFKKEVEKITLNAPKLPILSTVTGKWLTTEEATDPEYWSQHMRATVRFADAAETLLTLDDPLVLEVGPGNALSTLTRLSKGEKTLKCTPSLSVPKNGQDAYTSILNALGELWLQGAEPDWNAFYEDQSLNMVALPSYVFDRKPCWIDILDHKEEYKSQENNFESSTVNTEETQTEVMRKPQLLNKITEIISNISGIEIEPSAGGLGFLELGLDSLILTQLALSLKNEFKSSITFRQLNEELGTPELLAIHLDENLPLEQHAVNNHKPLIQDQKLNGVTVSAPMSFGNNGNQNLALNLISQQIQLLGQQIAIIQGGNATNNAESPSNFSEKIQETSTKIHADLSKLDRDERTAEEQVEHKKPFGASPRIERQSTDLAQGQQNYLEQLILRYTTKTAGSKAYSQKHREQMADPRVVSGFKPMTKEMVYPIVVEKSSGNRLWDLDGNEYLDALNGFGSCFFGHQPEFIKEALHDQIEKGYEVGPQHPLAGEVCKLLCEFTEHDRAALCNTGSEAVLGAMRIARTVTGRSLIVAFSGAYHGINDEALVRGSLKKKTFPAAAGIQPTAVQNILILDYGTPESLEIIKERADELAAVLVEPVQSRRPEFQPVAFLKELREVTSKSGITLIFDEVITGFRMHPGGAQALFGIKADLAAYGKVMGGGLSIGAILGKRKFMDALDGGHWQYGDNSFPEVGVTYFAGTFVRHPLALAASKASLIYMKEQGENLQQQLNVMTAGLVTALNNVFQKRGLPMQINYFGSLWRLKFQQEIPYGELLFVLLREKGIHIWDGFPCFLTTVYTQADIQKIIEAFTQSCDELITAGFFPSAPISNVNNIPKVSMAALNTPPVPEARLGRDEQGNPAWFVSQDGHYVKYDL